MLFTTEKKEVTKPADLKAFRTAAENKLRTATAKQSLAEAVGVPVMGEAIHLASFVKWSLHELVAYLFDYTGPGKLWLTTWAVSENPVRIINQLIESGQATDLRALFDRRIKSQCPQAYQLIKGQWKNIFLTDIHAKIAVIINDDWAISVTSTANLSNKQRIEKYVITCDRHIAEKEVEWIENAIQAAERLN